MPGKIHSLILLTLDGKPLVVLKSQLFFLYAPISGGGRPVKGGGLEVRSSFPFRQMPDHREISNGQKSANSLSQGYQCFSKECTFATDLHLEKSIGLLIKDKTSKSCK